MLKVKDKALDPTKLHSEAAIRRRLRKKIGSRNGRRSGTKSRRAKTRRKPRAYTIIGAAWRNYQATKQI